MKRKILYLTNYKLFETPYMIHKFVLIMYFKEEYVKKCIYMQYIEIFCNFFFYKSVNLGKKYRPWKRSKQPQSVLSILDRLCLFH